MKRAMNGLRKAPQNFQEFISNVHVKHLGFTCCRADPQIFWNKSINVRVSIYVDEPIAVGPQHEINTYFEALPTNIKY